jgi:hypothetical protein
MYNNFKTMNFVQRTGTLGQLSPRINLNISSGYVKTFSVAASSRVFAKSRKLPNPFKPSHVFTRNNQDYSTSRSMCHIQNHYTKQQSWRTCRYDEDDPRHSTCKLSSAHEYTCTCSIIKPEPDTSSLLRLGMCFLQHGFLLSLNEKFHYC